METVKPKRVWTVLNLFSDVHVHQVEICFNKFWFHKDQSAQWVNMFLFPKLILSQALQNCISLGKTTLSHKSRKIHWNLWDHRQMIEKGFWIFITPFISRLDIQLYENMLDCIVLIAGQRIYFESDICIANFLFQ